MGNSGSNIELPDQGDSIIRTQDEECDENPKGFGYELFRHLKKHGDSIAQIEASSGKQDTFPSFRKRCISVAIELKRRGVTPEDVITACTSNHLDTSIAFLSPLFIGAKFSALDPNMTVKDMKSLLELTKPKFIFVSKDAEEKMCTILKELNSLRCGVIVFGDTTSNISHYKEFLNHQDDEDERGFVPYQCADPKETAYILFSSGSTGTPKGICCSHFATCQTIKFMEKFNLNGLTITYSTLVWVSALFAVMANVITGTPRLICSIFEAEKTWKYIQEYKVQNLLFAPHDAITLIKHGKPSGDADYSHVKSVSTIGGGLSLQSIASLRELFPSALVVCPYGQSEVQKQIFGFPLDKFDYLFQNPNCAGWPAKGIWYKVVDPVTEEICGPNRPGELRIKTRFQMNGYYKIDSKDCWDADGFLKTGDMVYYTEDHAFFVVERLKEMLRYKMRAISPTHLENILMEHPSVKIAVVVGIPMDEGDIPLGLVVKRVEDVTSEELEEFLAENMVDMASYLPRIKIKFIDECEISKTSSGKIRRFLLKRKILEQFNSVDLFFKK